MSNAVKEKTVGTIDEFVSTFETLAFVRLHWPASPMISVGCRLTPRLTWILTPVERTASGFWWPLMWILRRSLSWPTQATQARASSEAAPGYVDRFSYSELEKS